ncbi:hypothetical protein [endosymbiont GvMRE of Glomus versiforme]|uniref:hypothetical protein n=1 Tax=endosymbiont GvMRE of Glomus versiforme TaxID=2039283 RepID=UPI000ECCFF72|nr:hypothetical protein [endosymbiont GvMRE of Glomus versiforme]RHZ37643.1 hypothetical protein GvMRE_I1g516 [endosymbiont GvMRE of Glomus versiforme]
MTLTDKKKLTVEKQREIIFHNFHKLKNKYLNQGQKPRVHLGELEDDYWRERRRKSYGFTYYVKKDKNMWVFIRLFRKRKIQLKEIFDTLAHEFAHVWLNFIDPIKYAKEEHKHGKEHEEKLKEYYQYLMENLETEEKEIINNEQKK